MSHLEDQSTDTSHMIAIQKTCQNREVFGWFKHMRRISDSTEIQQCIELYVYKLGVPGVDAGGSSLGYLW